jgi:hypothetical protein
MTVHALFITDASGSMNFLASDVRGGHNAYLDQVTAKVGSAGEDVLITSTVFNTTVTIIDNAVPVAQATRFDEHNYVPDGMTALLDAVGQTLRQFLAKTKLEPGDKVFVYIQTDGLENSSTEYNNASVAAVIKELEAKEWAFVFSGTGPGDWNEQSRSMGLSTSTSNSRSSGGTRAAYDGRTRSTIDYLEAEEAERSTFTSVAVSGIVQGTIDQAEAGDATA